jgi:ribonucleotide reductase alpha subunit
MKNGVRNSLLTALMPTATTAQIMGNTEAFEPVTSNLYVRQTLAGEYTVINEQLVRDLIERKLWTKEIYEEIVYDNGSVQNIADMPQDLKDLYKTAYEIKQSAIIRQAADRGPFIDQSQSMNLFISSPDFSKLSSCHFLSWKTGLKTFSYYLRTRPVADPVKFGLDIHSVQSIKQKKETVVANLEIMPLATQLATQFGSLTCKRKKPSSPGETSSSVSEDSDEPCLMCSS